MAIFGMVAACAFVACISAVGLFSFGEMAYGILKGYDEKN